jgi:hypothetical protein
MKKVGAIGRKCVVKRERRDSDERSGWVGWSFKVYLAEFLGFARLRPCYRRLSVARGKNCIDGSAPVEMSFNDFAGSTLVAFVVRVNLGDCRARGFKIMKRYQSDARWDSFGKASLFSCYGPAGREIGETPFTEPTGFERYMNRLGTHKFAARLTNILLITLGRICHLMRINDRPSAIAQCRDIAGWIRSPDISREFQTTARQSR